MGAHNIEFELEGKKTMSEIETAFKKQREHDRDYNGHQEGYSGDFQTVDRVNYKYLSSSKVFACFNEAHDFCLKHAEKWVDVVAVYYLAEPLKSAKAKKLGEKVAKLREELNVLKRGNGLKAKGFHTCKNCKSRLNLEHLGRYDNCPLCRTDLRPATLKRKIERLEAKIKVLIDKGEAEKLKVATKLLQRKNAKINTLVAGWGAS